MVSCALCSDDAVTARVLAVFGVTAICDLDGCTSAVAIDLVPEAEAGDVLVCHAGIALQKAEPE